MSLDKETIKHIERQAIALSAKVPGTDRPMVYTPDGMELIGIERFQDQPYRHCGDFTTTRIQSFIDYVIAHKEGRTQLFVNDTGMVAQAAFDHYMQGETVEESATGWREHTTSLTMEQTPEWSALVVGSRNKGVQFTQREFQDFMSDWSHVITFKDGDEKDVPTQRVYQAVQKLEIKKTDTATHEDKDYRVSRGKLEELDVKGADSDLPATMHLACPTHIGLEPTVVECRLLVLAGENKVALGYRVMALEKILDESAKDFAAKIKAGVGNLPLWMGSFIR